MTAQGTNGGTSKHLVKPRTDTLTLNMKFQMPPDITSADAEENIGTTAVRRKLTTAHMYDCPGDKRWHRLTPREFQNRNADAQLPSISRNAGPDKVTANKNIQTSPDITNADAKEDIRIVAAPRKSTNIQ
jgi:hypothetical protein